MDFVMDAGGNEEGGSGQEGEEQQIREAETV